MSRMNDLVIENGVLKRYTGNDTAVVVPAGVTSIGDLAFEANAYVYLKLKNR